MAPPTISSSRTSHAALLVLMCLWTTSSFANYAASSVDSCTDAAALAAEKTELSQAQRKAGQCLDAVKLTQYKRAVALLPDRVFEYQGAEPIFREDEDTPVFTRIYQFDEKKVRAILIPEGLDAIADIPRSTARQMRAAMKRGEKKTIAGRQAILVSDERYRAIFTELASGALLSIASSDVDQKTLLAGFEAVPIDAFEAALAIPDVKISASVEACSQTASLVTDSSDIGDALIAAQNCAAGIEQLRKEGLTTLLPDELDGYRSDKQTTQEVGLASLYRRDYVKAGKSVQVSVYVFTGSESEETRSMTTRLFTQLVMRRAVQTLRSGERIRINNSRARKLVSGNRVTTTQEVGRNALLAVDSSTLSADELQVFAARFPAKQLANMTSVE